MDHVMTSLKPRLHKPRNSLRSGVKPNTRTGAKSARAEAASASGLDLAPAIEALDLLLELERPADAQLSAFFRNYPNFGARDRSFIAEAVYGVLRRLRSLQVLAAPATPRRLLLAWLAPSWRISRKRCDWICLTGCMNGLPPSTASICRP
jgi:hypothetical protein